MLYSGLGGAGGFGGYSFGGAGAGYAPAYASYGGLSGYSSGQLFTSTPQFAQYGSYGQAAYGQPTSPLRGMDYGDKNFVVVSPSTGGFNSFSGYQQIQPQVRTQQLAVSPQPQSQAYNFGFPQQFSGFGGYGQALSAAPQVYSQGGQQFLQRSPSGLAQFGSGINFGSAGVLAGQQIQQQQPQQQVRALPSPTPGAFQIPRVNAVPAAQARPAAAAPVAAAAAPRPAAPPSQDGDVARDYWGRPLNGQQGPRRPELANSARTGERPQDWKHLMSEQK